MEKKRPDYFHLDENECYATVNCEGALLVDGIEKWSETLLPVSLPEPPPSDRIYADWDFPKLTVMVDPKTGAKFGLCRIIDPEIEDYDNG